MKILTVRGQDSSGKSTLLTLGAAALIKKHIGKKRDGSKTRVLLLTKTSTAMRHLERLFNESVQDIGMIGCESGEHGCFIQHRYLLDEGCFKNLLPEAYDYVVADYPNWQDLFGWARRNRLSIRHLIATECADALHTYNPLEDMDNVAA